MYFTIYNMHFHQEKVAFLEPIFNMLKNIQERLDALERKD
jgi:hypothetical protein